jgi:hypothetical protein
MDIHIQHGDIHLLDIRTRMPFKYGIATMTSTPHLFLRLQVEVDSQPATGIAADHLPPKWFTKDPDRPVGEETHEMLRVVEKALQLAVELRAESAFDAWLRHQEAQSAWGRDERLPPLLTQFGTSLVERAVIEAGCRVAGRPFHELLRTDAFGVRPGDVYAELAGHAPAEFLPERPLDRVIVRHTIGLLDPLEDVDIAPGERLDDGLPQSLAACIRAYGLRHFKIKISGDLTADMERLRRIEKVLRTNAPADYAFSLDGNERFDSLHRFCSYWIGLQLLPAWPDLAPHLLFVEQPVHRSAAFRPAELLGNPRDWTGRPSILIDESDAEPVSLGTALRVGYAGTSHKNCKGVFKSVINFCLLEQRRRERPDERLLLSGEDLANIGPVALLQDLAVCAALGIASVERNGHHYFAGLSMFPPDVQRQVLDHHGDLYHPGRDGWPTLAIQGGAVATGSLLRAPFGVGFEMPVEQFLTPDAWRRANPV